MPCGCPRPREMSSADRCRAFAYFYVVRTGPLALRAAKQAIDKGYQMDMYVCKKTAIVEPDSLR